MYWRKGSRAGAYIGGCILAIFFLAPVVWVGITSLKNPVDATELSLRPFKPVFSNYMAAWRNGGFNVSFINTVVVGLGTVAISTLAGLPMAYSLARYPVPLKGFLGRSLLVLRILPEMVFLLPLYGIYRRTGLFDTRIGLMLAFQIITLPYSVWLLHSFVNEVPAELEEAARVDGCPESAILSKIVFPIIAPGVAASAVLSFVAVWTSLLFPLALSYSRAQTVSVAIANFKGYGTFNWPIMAAASVIATVPQFIFFGLVNKHLVAGLTAGAVKG